MIRVIDSFEEFAAMGRSWDDLLGRSRSRGVFLTHEWLSAWWKHLSGARGLSIVTVTAKDRLIAILPLASRPPDLLRMTPRTLEFLGSGIIGSDYLDAIVDAEAEDEALTQLEAWLERTACMLQLSQLRLGGSAVERLARRMAQRGWTASAAPVNVCPYIPLEGRTWEDYWATLGASQRYNFQRRLKNLQKCAGFRVECARTPQDAAPALETLMNLHHQRWQGRGESSEAFQTPAVCDFHREFVRHAAARGWLRLFTMFVDGAPCAALYGLRYADTFSFYQSGFDPAFRKHSVGLVMMGLAIRSAVDEGCTEYDFLHGGEEYKYHWTRDVRDLGRLELFPNLASAWIYRHAVDLNRSARRMAKRVLQRA